MLRCGEFSPVIALCGTSPGGTLTDADRKEGVRDDVWSGKPSAKRPNTADKNLTLLHNMAFTDFNWNLNKLLVFCWPNNLGGELCAW